MKSYLKTLVILIIPVVLLIAMELGLDKIDAWSTEPAKESIKASMQGEASTKQDADYLKENHGLDLVAVIAELDRRDRIRGYSLWVCKIGY